MTLRKDTTPVPAPSLHISAADYDVIADLALRLAVRDQELGRLILGEIDRADVRDQAVASDVVAIGSKVTFADDGNGVHRTVELVLPGQADIACNRISVMTPVGAGLIGMRAGSEIEWPYPDGRARSLRILRVEKGDG